MTSTLAYMRALRATPPYDPRIFTLVIPAFQEELDYFVRLLSWWLRYRRT